MTALLFLLLLAAALAVQAFARLAPATQDRLIAKANAMIASTVDRLQQAIANKLLRRRMSYRALFFGEGLGRGELSPAGRIVIADLARFCRAYTSTTVVSEKSGVVDPIASAVAEGRREVFLRLLKELSLDPALPVRAMQEEDALAA